MPCAARTAPPSFLHVGGHSISTRKETPLLELAPAGSGPESSQRILVTAVLWLDDQLVPPSEENSIVTLSPPGGVPPFAEPTT